MEFKDLHDSPSLQPRFYLIHPQHFAQVYPALEDHQKSSRIYLCSLLNRKRSFAGSLLFVFPKTKSTATYPRRASMRASCALPPFSNTRKARSHPLEASLSTMGVLLLFRFLISPRPLPYPDYRYGQKEKKDRPCAGRRL